MSIGKSIFIDFEIIKNSDPKNLKNELEEIVKRKNEINVWSKKEPTINMRLFCLNIKFNLKDEVEKHKKVLELRKQKKTYEEISKESGVPVKQLWYFISNPIKETWTLDDWIKGYYKKDSTVYQKPDIVIDPDETFVKKFISRGIEGNVVSKI